MKNKPLNKKKESHTHTDKNLSYFPNMYHDVYTETFFLKQNIMSHNKNNQKNNFFSKLPAFLCVVLIFYLRLIDKLW